MIFAEVNGYRGIIKRAPH